MLDPTKHSFIETARRAQIIECAIDALAELGFGQASLAQIAKRAGISTGVISYHFAGKEELLRAVVAHVVETAIAFIRPRVDATAGPRVALRSTVVACVQHIGRYPKNCVAIWNIVLAGRGDLYQPAGVTTREASFIRVLEWGQREGAFRPFDVPIMARFICNALDGLMGRLVLDPKFDVDAAGRELGEVVDRATRCDRE
jgi:TetR/AcrR family transcriptional regulator, fatty acid metabolism regulator protein